MVDAIIKFVLLISALTFVVDLILPRRYAIRLGSYLETFWLKIDELSTHDNLILFLGDFRHKLKKLKPTIAKAMLAFYTAIILIFNATTLYNGKFEDNLYYNIRRFVSSDVRLAIQHATYEKNWSNKFWADAEISCVPDPNSPLKNLSVKLSYIYEAEKLIISNTRGVFFTLFFAVNAYFLIYATICFCSLIASMRLTDFFLNRIAKYSKNLILYTALDVILAIILPATILTAFAALVMYFISPIHNEYEIIFAPASVAPYILILRYVFITNFFGFAMLASYLMIITSSALALYQNGLSLIWLTLGIIKVSIVGYLVSMQQVFRGGILSIDIGQSANNYLFSLSLIYSLIYIFSTLLMFMCLKSPVFKELVQNSIQYIIDNKRGPIASISVVAGALALLLQNILK